MRFKLKYYRKLPLHFHHIEGIHISREISKIELIESYRGLSEVNIFYKPISKIIV